jgi:DNA-binding NarL/FixJ family response regulator
MHRHLQTRAVLLADECLLREDLRRVLEAGGVVVVAHSTTAEELVRKVSAHRPDVVVVAQGASGAVLGAAVAFRRRLPAAALLVLGVDVRRTIARELLAAGTSGIGYVLDRRVEDVGGFLDAVRRVSAGGTVLDPEVVSCLLAREDPLGVLTSREREVAALIAEGRSNRGIARRLVVTETAVEKHVGKILAKFEIPASHVAHRRVLAALAYLETTVEPLSA